MLDGVNQDSGISIDAGTDLSLEQISEITKKIFFAMPQVKTDVAIIFGCPETNAALAVEAAKLYHLGAFSYIIVSGGNKAYVENPNLSEAEIMRGTLLAQGVPNDAILFEDKSTNTGENVTYSMPILEQIGATSVTAICRTPHQLRVMMTLRRYLPDIIITTATTMVPKNITPENWFEDPVIRSFTIDEYRKTNLPQENPPYVALGYCAAINLAEEQASAKTLPPLFTSGHTPKTSQPDLKQ